MNKQILEVLDVIMSEYGWTLDYSLKLPVTVIQDLYKIICNKQKADNKFQTKLQVIAIGAAFSDKGLAIIDKVFKPESTNEETPAIEVDEDAQKSQMRNLWVRMGKDLKDFDEHYNKGEVQF